MTQKIVTYILAALIVLILGAFSGWYFFLKTQSQTLVADDAARGFGNATPLGNAGGSGGAQNAPAPQGTPIAGPGFFSRLLGSITGRGTGVSESSSPASDLLDVSEPTSTTSLQTSTSAATVAPRPPQLSHTHNKPIAGMSFVKIGGKEVLRYVERSTGYIFEVNPETGIVTRLTNTLTPKIYAAFFTKDGRVVERSLDDGGDIVTTIGSIATSTGTIANATTSAQLVNVPLAKNIVQITSDPKSGALFYLANGTTGAVGIRSLWNGTKQTRVFSSSIPHWNPLWLSDGRIILTQAAADDTPGYAYELKSDGTLSSLIRNIPGLTVLPRAEGAMLYSQSSGGALALFAQVKPDATAIKLPVNTVTEKCAWSLEKTPIAYCGVPRGITTRYFLNDWYRGATHTSDVLSRIDASAGTAETVYTPGIPLDVENLTVDSAGAYLAFMNAADKSLWMLRLEK